MKQTTSPPARRWLFGIISIVALVAAILISRQLMITSPKAERRPPERRARLVEVKPVNPSRERVAISAYGQVEAAQKITLSAQVSGVITDLGKNFVPGQRIRKGELLLTIDDRDYRIAMDAAKSDLASAEASLAQEAGSQAVARADFELFEVEVAAAEKALMLRQPQLRAAQASVSRAKAAVRRAQLDLDRTRIRAPFDAVVLSRNVGLGAQVNGPASNLGELAKASPYWITLLVPVESLRWIELPSEDARGGSEVTVHDVSRMRNASWRGRVIQLLDAVEEQGRRARLLVEVNPVQGEDKDSLLLGSYVEARIQGKEIADVFRLDPGWLQQEQVWVVREERLVNIALDVLHRGPDSVLARGALRAGDQVVSSRLSSAVEGMKVRLPEVAAPESPQQLPAGVEAP